MLVSSAPLIIIAVVIALPFVWLIVNYNRFAQLQQYMLESWSDIEVEMKRRYELIPNLVETAKGYANHERELFEKVVELRNQAMANHGTATQQAVDETALALGVKKLFAVAEAYPELKANMHFLALQQELANTEDRIAAARRFYNGNVRDINQLCEQFPTNFLADMFGFQHATYFELSSEAERVVPRVSVS